MSAQEDSKKTVIAFYQTAFAGEPEQAVTEHVGDRYIQHNPQAQDGSDSFVGFVHYLRREYPEMQLDIKQVIAEGNLVVTHAHLI